MNSCSPGRRLTGTYAKKLGVTPLICAPEITSAHSKYAGLCVGLTSCHFPYTVMKVPHEVARVIPLFPRVLLPLFASLFLISAEVRGQDNQTLSRITDPVEESQLTVTKGNVHNMARPMFDRGPAPPSLPMPRMLLVLQPLRGSTAVRRDLSEGMVRESWAGI